LLNTIMRKLLLLDANVIIDLHTLGLFDKISKSYDLYVTPEVLKESDRFPFEGSYHPISIKDKVKVVQDVSIDTTNTIRKEAEEAGLAIEEGEATSIAYITQAIDEDVLFCTCDKAAIRLVSFMNLEEKSISVEKALRNVGYHQRNLYPRHFEKVFQECIKEGKTLRILHKKLT